MLKNQGGLELQTGESRIRWFLFRGIPIGTKEISDITEILGSLYTVRTRKQDIVLRAFLEGSFSSFGVN